MREGIFGEDIYKKSKKKANSFDPGRREFMKKAAAIGLGVGAGLVLDRPVKNGLKWLGREIADTAIKKEEEWEKAGAAQTAEKNSNARSEVRGKLPPPPAEYAYIRGQDEQAVQKLVGNFNLDPVNLAGTEKATENYVYFQHVDDPKLAASLEEGYIAMQRYVPRLKEIFEKEGVPEEYIYLALSESYWNLHQVSPAGAVGPYQITKATAKLYHMNPQDRTDPMASAELCASYLARVHEKSGSWEVALCAYNGKYANEFMGELWEKNHSHRCDYSQFEAFMEEKINKLKRKLRQNEWEYKISPGETLSKIAAHFGLNEEKIAEIVKVNHLESEDDIRAGESIKIPIRDRETKRKIYENEIGGIMENLNYLARFRAIYARIHDQYFLQKVAAKEDFEKIKIAREQLNTKY